MRIVFDTDVLIAALITHGLCRRLVRTHLAADDIITSPTMLDELQRTVRRKLGADPGEVPLLRILRERAELVRPHPPLERICRDPDDDWVLATAVAGRADFIITGDEDLLVLKKHRDVRILSPRQFLEMIDRQP